MKILVLGFGFLMICLCGMSAIVGIKQRFALQFGGTHTVLDIVLTLLLSSTWGIYLLLVHTSWESLLLVVLGTITVFVAAAMLSRLFNSNIQRPILTLFIALRSINRLW